MCAFRGRRRCAVPSVQELGNSFSCVLALSHTGRVSRAIGPSKDCSRRDFRVAEPGRSRLTRTALVQSTMSIAPPTREQVGATQLQHSRFCRLFVFLSGESARQASLSDHSAAVIMQRRRSDFGLWMQLENYVIYCRKRDAAQHARMHSAGAVLHSEDEHHSNLRANNAH